MPISQREISLQMLAQLRLLDPSASAEVGTPERKIIDTVATALAENQVDLTLLSGQLDFNAKFGENLDRFFSLFRFNRQSAAFAEGFVRFGRLTPATVDIRIPTGTQVMAPTIQDTSVVVDALESGNAVFATTFDVYLRAGETSVIAPVRAVSPGTTGNVSSERITMFVNEPVLGITEVTNEHPTKGGIDQESDEEFKVRFRNTVFRNLAGTQDQYLALGLATAYSAKANVVGPISRYREYIQVPKVDDDSSYESGGLDYGDGNGEISEYTTALSTLPYAKHIWDDVPYFVTNGDLGPSAIFYRPDTDFRLNLLGSDKDRGDAHRFFHNLSPPIGDDPRAAYTQPNVTFMNVYTGSDSDVEAIHPNDVVLQEFSYMSNASRNDYDRKILNCVDVFIDGQNIKLSSTVIPRPNVTALFIDDVNSKYHYDNYRRAGEPERRPILGNVLSPLFWQPTTDIPDEISVEVDTDTYIFTRGVHYWLVEDISEYGGTIRARNGIEWSIGVGAQGPDDDDDGPYTGPYVTELPSDIAIAIQNYSYDQNLVDLQTSLEANKQVTTDVLAHRGQERYYKLDISVMLDQGVSQASVNQGIHAAISDFFDGQFFGGVVQLSDLLQVIHNVAGVDNVRWSSDVPNQPDLSRVKRTDIFGRPIINVLVDRRQQASADRSAPDIQQIVITGEPTNGTFKLQYDENTSSVLDYDIDAATLLTELESITSNSINTVTGTGTYFDPFVVTFDGTTERSLLTATEVDFAGGPSIYDSDFILNDNELPALPLEADVGDSAPGLIVRLRAQHTWTRI